MAAPPPDAPPLDARPPAGPGLDSPGPDGPHADSPLPDGPLPDDAALRALLARTRRIALVGASANPARPSHGVMRFLLARGYDVTPVNPGLAGTTLLGRPVAATLDDVAGPLDLVDVFRASAQAGAVVDDAIRLGARAVWLQLGVLDPPAIRRARAAGLDAVMDRCPAIEWPRLLGEGRPGPLPPDPA